MTISNLKEYIKSNDIEMLKDIKSINNIANAFDYIISSEYYILLSKVFFLKFIKLF